MSETLFIERCQAFIDCHLQTPKTSRKNGGLQLPAVALSRETGAGGTVVAHGLAKRLQEMAPPGSAPWTVFDKNLVQKMLEEHNLPSRLAQFIPEDRVSGIQDAVEELLGLHPPSWSLLRQMTETVLHLAELGHVILLGRGANVITAHLPHVLQVRLTGSPERRARRVMEVHKIGAKAAAAFLKKQDAARKRFLRRNFHRDPDDPLLYHVVLNTDLVGFEEAVDVIAGLVRVRYRA